MIKNKRFLFLILGMFLVFTLVFVSSADVCCKKTDAGDLCKYVDESQCTNYPSSPNTDCDQTNFCKEVTCIGSVNGECSRTYNWLCQEAGGSQSLLLPDQIPGCQQGCCLFGTDASMITQEECNKIGSDYNVNVAYDSTINNEVDCLALSNTRDEGACIYELNGIKSCTREVKEDCYLKYLNPTFKKDHLCSAPGLNTGCEATENTIIHNFDVYFEDSCHNKANIYDLTRLNEIYYWTKIVKESNSCGPVGNINDAKICGNCDLVLGTIAK